jgi:hypothetical protein
MNQSENYLIQTISNTLIAYAISKKLAFAYGGTPLSLEETFYENGGLILFLYEAKSMYESIYKEEFIASIFEYNEESCFPLGMLKKDGVSIFDYIPILHSSKNFENVIIFSIHALIELMQEYESKLLPLDDLHLKFHKKLSRG